MGISIKGTSTAAVDEQITHSESTHRLTTHSLLQFCGSVCLIKAVDAQNNQSHYNHVTNSTLTKYSPIMNGLMTHAALAWCRSVYVGDVIKAVDDQSCEGWSLQQVC